METFANNLHIHRVNEIQTVVERIWTDLYLYLVVDIYVVVPRSLDIEDIAEIEKCSSISLSRGFCSVWNCCSLGWKENDLFSSFIRDTKKFSFPIQFDPRIRKFFFHLRRYVNTSEDMICRDGEFDQGFTFDALAKLPQSLQPWIDYHNDVNFHKCFVMNVCDSFNNIVNFKIFDVEFLDIFFFSSFLSFRIIVRNLLNYIYN